MQSEADAPEGLISHTAGVTGEGLAPFGPRFVPIHNRLRGASLVS